MRLWGVLATLLLATNLAAAPRRPVKLTVLPANTFLFGKGATQSLVVVVQFNDSTEQEVTDQARFASARPTVARVEPSGVVRAQKNGVSKIRATYRGLAASMTAFVEWAKAPPRVSFGGDVLPVLTKIGCNGGNCHGALNGQNGFKLSLFGYDPAADYEMIAHKDDGRRINLKDPEQSLLLLKPSFQIPHGGGEVLPKGSAEYQRVLDWIRAGASRTPGVERKMVALRVHPSRVVLYGRHSKRRLLVTATYSDGTEGDVTRQVKFQSNDDNLASVDREGFVTGIRGGETAVVVRGPGVAAATKVGVVLEKRAVSPVRSFNFIDDHVFAKLHSLSIPPSDLADDATFLRRAYLDIIGLVPPSEEARRFLADKDPEKRAKLVDALLVRPEYADFWTVYWGDRLHNSIESLYGSGPQNFTRWIHNAFRKNMPFDQFARALVTSTGSLYDSRRAASYYPLIKKPADFAAVTSQLFLGVRIECARCHNHPFEKWTQNDFRGMAAFFSQVGHKPSGPRGSEYVLFLDFQKQFEDPDTKQIYYPRPLDAPLIKPPEGVDRRELLADWLTSPTNPYFARTIVNRMWRCFMGRGLVEPVDDFRVTNPPTNEPLLDALARDFIEHAYDLRHLIRRITRSRAYQLSSEPNEANRDDTVAYSRYYPRHLSAEQLLDSISEATGVPEDFPSFYPGTRAAQLTHPEVKSYFLDVFNRPPRKEVYERTFRPTLNQVMHRISGDTVHQKVTHPQGALGRRLAAHRPPQEIVEELYLRTLSRYPSAREHELALGTIARAGDATRGLEDIFWALLNSKEFLYNH